MVPGKAPMRWCCLILFYIIRCSPQQCVTTDFKKKFSGKLNESDYKPLISMQENSYGKLLHKCLHYCEQDKRCIGFQICKVSESLFQCQTCCHWRKFFRYTYTNTSDCKYLEKEVDFTTNLARNKTTTLSSTLEGHISSNAVDGNTYCDKEISIAASTDSLRPHLLIQLGGTYNVEKVVIHSRSTAHGNQLDNIVILINDQTINQTCGGEYPGPTANGDIILFLCPSGTRGSNIKIQKTAPYNRYLGLCEVEVYGYP